VIKNAAQNNTSKFDFEPLVRLGKKTYGTFLHISLSNIYLASTWGTLVIQKHPVYKKRIGKRFSLPPFKKRSEQLLDQS